MGSVTPRDGKPPSRSRYWQLAVSMGRDPVTGKYRRKTRRFHGTYREAMAELARFEATVKVPTGHMTVEDAARAWLDQELRYGHVAPSTARKKRQHLGNLVAWTGSKDVDRVTTSELQGLFDAMLAGEGPSGRRCGRTYVRMVQQTTASLFAWCLSQGVATHDPCAKVVVAKADTPERRALTRAQSEALVAACSPPDRHEAGLLLALMAGLRRGEACALRWEDVDLGSRTIRVRGTKTAASDAIIPMSPRLASILSSMPRRGETVMAGDHGEPMEPHAFSHWWRLHRVEYGLDGYTIHELRHTFATRLAENDVHPAAMAKLMRHSDPRTTLMIYTHVQAEDLSWAVDGI